MATTRYILSQEEIDRIAEIASREAVRAYASEQKKIEKKELKKRDKVARTKKMLGSYRRMKATLKDEAEFTEEEQIELRWKFIEDLMGTSDIVTRAEVSIIDKEKKRQENLYCIHAIETAMSRYKDECDRSSSDEAKRRYREVYAMYIEETPSTVSEIAERENVSEQTVYKDISISCGIIAVYLLGIQ